MIYDLEPYHGKNARNIPVSYSEISMYKECKRKWWLTYYRGLSPLKYELIGPLPLGTRVHFALERKYKYGENPVTAYTRQLNIDRGVFESGPDGQVEEKVKKFNDEAELGRLMVEGYEEWLEESGEDDKYSVLAVEKEVSHPFLDGRFRVRGKVDLKVEDNIDGAILSMDHKTSARPSDFNTIAMNSEQLMMYTLLEKLNNEDGAPVEGGIYSILKKVKRTKNAKPPFYTRIVVRFNDDTMKSYWTRLNGTLRDMIRTRDELDAGADHRYVAYPTPTKDCAWKCPFFQVCPLFDDGSAAESMLYNHFTIKNPYERYENDETEQEI